VTAAASTCRADLDLAGRPDPDDLTDLADLVEPVELLDVCGGTKRDYDRAGPTGDGGAPGWDRAAIVGESAIVPTSEPDHADVHPAIPGAEPMSHVAGEPDAPGALVSHGFTGNPSSMRIVADALAAAGFHVELPLLPGHGTEVADMVPTRWADWTGAIEVAYERLAARADRIVAAGLSMGGSLALWTALRHPDVAGLVLVNPATQPQPPEVREMIGDLLAGGTELAPAIGSDVAEPGVVELAYEATPLAALVSLLDDGLAPMAGRYGELTVPLLLFTSRQDHVVPTADSEHLAATYGGQVDRRWLERSYHVATQDYDRHDIAAAAVEFARRVTSATEPTA
jgi:carboxylesterase